MTSFESKWGHGGQVVITTFIEGVCVTKQPSTLAITLLLSSIVLETQYSVMRSYTQAVETCSRAARVLSDYTKAMKCGYSTYG